MPEKFAAGQYWVIDGEDGSFAGSVGITPRDGNAWLCCLHVSPTHRGKGFGRQLLRFSLQQAREQGFPAVQLLSLEGVFAAAMHMYASEGFQIYCVAVSRCKYVWYQSAGRAA